MNAHLKKYQQTQIQTASPEKLLIMLYNGCINFLNQSKKYMEIDDKEQTNKFLLKAQAIITEFMDTIEFEPNPEFAQNLYSLYEYMNHTLVQANIKKDPEKVDTVLNLLKTLKSAWEEAAVKIAKDRGIQESTQQVDITDEMA